MLSIAAREANIIGILPKALANGTISNDIAERSAATIEQKVSWIRQAAGQRFSQIELSMVISAVITEHQQQSAEQFANQRGWSQLSVEQVLELPSVFIGSVDQIVEKMYKRRERFGFSYYVVPDESLEEFAPVVQRLAGR